LFGMGTLTCRSTDHPLTTTLPNPPIIQMQVCKECQQRFHRPRELGAHLTEAHAFSHRAAAKVVGVGKSTIQAARRNVSGSTSKGGRPRATTKEMEEELVEIVRGRQERLHCIRPGELVEEVGVSACANKRSLHPPALT